MNVRRIDTPAVPVASATAPVPASVPRERAGSASGFDGSRPRESELTRAERTLGHVAQSILPGDMPNTAPGPIPLWSEAARAAISQTEQYLALNLSLGIPGQAEVQFEPRLVEVDDLGMTHVRMDRYQDGVKVFGEQVITHLDSQGNVVGLTGGEELTPIPADVSGAAPQLTEAQALKIAQGAYAKSSEHAPVVEQVLFRRDDGSYAKAFRVELTDFACERPERMNFIVDGSNGEVLCRWNQMGGIELPKEGSDFVDRPTGGGETPAPQGDDTSLYSGMVELQTTQNPDGSWSLDDQTRGGGVVTRDAQNKTNGNSAVELRDDNNIWGEVTDSPRTKAAVDAHYGAQMTYDMYRDVLGRDSIDGKGERLISNVHVRTNYVNAFWDGKQMSYGDGDGRTAGPLTTLDIAGHEISHGLTERTAGLIYRGESGGINESMSDIMGTGVEWYAAQKNPAVKFDWTLGEDCWTPNNGDDTDGLRYMDDPTKDRYSVDHYSNYPKQTEVHGSSGIMNNAFYLLAQGGTNRTSGIEVKGGIGVENSLKIYGRALMFYMTPTTTFRQAREACLKAAADLFGANSAEVQKVKESWSAVGVN